MQSPASSVAEYLASLPEERRLALEEIRKTIRANLHRDFEEGMQYGMIGYYLPHAKYPDGYHCDPTQPLPFAAVASQKNHISLYLYCVYASEEDRSTFVEEWTATGQRLDMGSSCVRAKRLDQIPLEVVGRALRRMDSKRFVECYEASLDNSAGGRKVAARKPRKPAAKKVAAKKTAAKKTAAKKTAVRKPAQRSKRT